MVRLHIDTDEVRPPSTAPDRPPALSEDELVAAKFQERIASAANEGTTEQGVRQLIDDCRTFLNLQPRNSVRHSTHLHFRHPLTASSSPIYVLVFA